MDFNVTALSREGLFIEIGDPNDEHSRRWRCCGVVHDITCDDIAIWRGRIS
jgi:hypothetical protein